MVHSHVPKVPSLQLLGDGHNSSIIKATSTSPDCIAMTADALQQIDGSVGASGASLPGEVHVSGLTFYASVDTVDSFVINPSTKCYF